MDGDPEMNQTGLSPTFHHILVGKGSVDDEMQIKNARSHVFRSGVGDVTYRDNQEQCWTITRTGVP